MKDSLGDRMKRYEVVTQQVLMKRTYTIIRVDGKAFHTYTKGLERPFDDRLMSDMDETAKFLCQNIQNAKLAFVQSDEISVVITDFDELETESWFDNKVQKIVSVSASLATGKFIMLRPHKLATFDSRVWQVPTRTEACNYLIWRQQDTTRNSISSVAQSLYPHKELLNKSSNQKQEMIFQKGTNWNDYSARYKRGRIIVRETVQTEKGTRTKWNMVEPPIFTEDKEFLNNIIPLND